MNEISQTVLQASLFLGALGGFFAVCTVFTRLWLLTQEPRNRLEDRVNDMLPQIQCAKCGYPGCMPYAEAIVQGERLDLCPPGGEAVTQAIGELLGRPTTGPTEMFAESQVASIDEKDCVGCTLCIRACPVDAIIGSEGFMHTVLRNHCTGCELCVPACPVDCIDLVENATAIS